MPRKPRSEPRSRQSIPATFQSSRRKTSRASRSIMYTPPSLWRWWVPRTTEVATSFKSQASVKSELSPFLRERQVVAQRPLQVSDVMKTRVAEYVPVGSAAQVAIAVVVEDVAHDERR